MRAYLACAVAVLALACCGLAAPVYRMHQAPQEHLKLTRFNAKALQNSTAVPTRFVAPGSLESASASMDMSLAVQGLLLSTAAYCRSSVGSWTCGPCRNSSLWKYSNVETFYAKKTDTFGYVAVAPNNGYIVVSFEGSHDLKQFIEDIKFVKVDTQYPGAGRDVRVHGGFYQSYEIVSDFVTAQVQSQLSKNPGFKVLVTGHSLGAAIAVFCTLDLRIKLPNVQIHHYTFGQPRVGNEAFHQFYEQHSISSSFRFVHDHDIVPHLPLESMGFHHIATEVFYRKYGGPSTLHVCNGSGEDPTCSDSNTADLSVEDHLHYLGYHLSSDSC